MEVLKKCVLLCLVLLVGCAPTLHRENQLLFKQKDSIKKYLLVTPDIKIYELSVGGVPELHDDWSDQGSSNALSSLKSEFVKKNVQIQEIKLDSNNEIKNTMALYGAVSRSVMTHVIGNSAYQFAEKSNHFDYSIGSVDYLIKEHDADALIFVYGYDEISSGGRQALGALGILAGAMTGVTIVPRGGLTFVSVSVVNNQGDVLWYGARASEGGADLRKASSVAGMLHNILNDYPGFKK